MGISIRTVHSVPKAGLGDGSDPWHTSTGPELVSPVPTTEAERGNVQSSWNPYLRRWRLGDPWGLLISQSSYWEAPGSLKTNKVVG